MKKKFLLIACVLCLCGCGFNDKKEVVRQLEFSLKGNPTTGYKWNCKVDNEEIAAIISNEYVEDQFYNKTVGMGGTYIYALEGINEGMTTLSCLYEHSFEKGEPLYSIEYVVSVKNKDVSLYSKHGTYFKEDIPMPKIFETTK